PPAPSPVRGRGGACIVCLSPKARTVMRISNARCILAWIARSEELMSGAPWDRARYGPLQGHPKYAHEREIPLRTVFNVRTEQFEEIPLPQFQQLLREGKIEEAETQSPYDGHPQRVYRLI